MMYSTVCRELFLNVFNVQYRSYGGGSVTVLAVSSSSLPSSGPAARRTPPSRACLEARVPACTFWLSCKREGAIGSATAKSSLRVVESVVGAVSGGCTKARAEKSAVSETPASVLDAFSPTCVVVDSPTALSSLVPTGDPCALPKHSSYRPIDAPVDSRNCEDVGEDLPESTRDRSIRPTYFRDRCITDY